MGGWGFDTPRRFIEADLRRLMDTFSPQDAEWVERSVIYGLRAQTGHIFLKQTLNPEASERFYALRAKYNNTVKTASDQFTWLAPSRTAARRSMNKMTRKAGQAILSLFPDQQQPKLEYSWAKQVIWLGDSRVAAGTMGR